MSDGFLGRWSRRKLDARAGRETASSAPIPAPPIDASTQRSDPLPPQPVGPAVSADMSASAASAEPAPPTLADVQALTPQSDFRPFVARGVAPEVKNAAVKKLFADPHFNVMDGLDTYIDDYNRPDPLPATMLRQLAAAQVMNLVAPEPLREDAEGAPVASVAEWPEGAPPVPADGAANDRPGPAGALPPKDREDHADTDLQLQPDHAARREGPGPGAG